MGFGDFFKNIFGKKNCALCGKECGMMHRSKIKNKEFLCSDCGNLCSKYIRLSELTLDEIKGHIEYMKRQNRLYEEVYSKEGKKSTCPSTVKEMGIEFCDDLGMFRIVYRSDTSRGKLKELFRYDQVAGYEEYIEETPATEQGKNPEFKECGLKIKLLGGNMSNVNTDNKKGLRPHPYIKREIKVCFSKKNQSDMQYVLNAKRHFDYIFGVHDDERGLFGFGRSKAEKREDAAAIGMATALGTAFKAATKGEDSITDEEKERLREGMDALNDAATGGMAVYTRRADEAEQRIK